MHPAEINLLKDVDIRHHPSGKALLLLHGFASSPGVFRELLPQITNYDAIYCPALPGHASNLAAFATCSAKEWIHAVESAYLKLNKNYQVIDVMGLSLGGALACDLSFKFPINHLYLLAPALALPFLPTHAGIIAKLLSYFGIKFINNNGGNLSCRINQELTYRKLPINAIQEVLKITTKKPIRIPKCPVDIFFGCSDDVIDSKKIAQAFQDAKNVKIHWLEHSAHILPLDMDKNAILEVMNGNSW